MEQQQTAQTEAQYTERERQLAAKHQVEPKLIRLLTEIAREQQEPADPLIDMECNSLIVEDYFSKVEFGGKLAAVLLFNLLTSSSERYRDIGGHILHNLNEAIYETDGRVSEADMFVRELLFAIVERKARKIA
jgi:hypothetical protein